MQVKARTSLGETIIYDEAPFNSGGNEGTVHKVIYPAHLVNHCIKIYHPEKRTPDREQKIAYMVNNEPDYQAEQFKICWPVKMIVHAQNSAFLGFLMQLAHPDSISLSELTLTRLSPKYKSRLNKFDRTTMEGSRKRLQICVNIAGAIHKLHVTGKYVIVDYKPENVLISFDGKVSIIDVDSFQIAEQSKILFHSLAMTPEYIPQESKFLNPAVDYIPETWDRFSMAISFYKILFGLHPFAGTPELNGPYGDVLELNGMIGKGLFVHGSKRHYLSKIPDPHSGFVHLSPVIQNLFMRTFEAGHMNPLSRPTAETWGKSIYTELIKNTALKRPLEVPKAVRNNHTPTAAEKPAAVHQPRPTPANSAAPGTTGAKVVTMVSNPAGQAKPLPAKKKESYMFWKIATLILLIGSVWLYNNYTNAMKELSATKAELHHSQLINNDIAASQNEARDLQEKLDQSQKKITTLTEKVSTISKKYPLSIKSVIFINVNDEGVSLSSESGSSVFAKSQLEYIVPIVTFASNIDQDTTMTIFYEIMDPDHNLLTSGEDVKIKSEIFISGSSDQPMIHRLPKYYINTGDNETREIPVGQYKINIWFNKTQMFQGKFEVISDDSE